MRQANVRDALLDAAEELFAAHGCNAVSLRQIAARASANVGSLTYHFGGKAGLLRAIYQRHCAPMNRRRLELLGEACRIRNLRERIEAIIRAYLLPAFSSSSDSAGGGARFTRMRAVLSAEGNEDARHIIAETFDATSHAFIDAIAGCLPGVTRETVVWRSQFLLGALYYTLINPERITRLSRGAVDGGDTAQAIAQIVDATVAGLLALAGRADAGVDRHHKRKTA